MGRVKLNMELIPNEKSRNSTFKKRKEGLVRKLHEFTTLCDVGACMIIYGPKQENGGGVEPEIWPAENPDEVRRMIDLYKARNRDATCNYCKTFGLSDFFHDRKRKIEEELEKLKRKNLEAKYPTGFDLSFLSETQLREFEAALNNKAQILRNRVDFLKRNKRRLLESQSNQEIPPLNPSHYVPSLIGPQYYASAAPLQYMQYAVLGGEAPPQLQFYPMAAENVDFHHFDGGLEDMNVQPQHYMQYTVVDGVVPPQQVQFHPPENGGLEDILQYYHQM